MFDFWMHAESAKDLNKYVVKYVPRILGSIYVYTNSKFLLAMEKAVLSFTSLLGFFFHSPISCKNMWIFKILEKSFLKEIKKKIPLEVFFAADFYFFFTVEAFLEVKYIAKQSFKKLWA